MCNGPELIPASSPQTICRRQDNSVVGVPSVHGGTAYPTHCKAAGGKDVGVDQV